MGDFSTSLTPLIIIASAFSVFGQYVNNRQQDEVGTIKQDINSANISKIQVEPMKSYLEDQRAALIQEGEKLCDRSFGPIQALFGLLILALALEMCFTLHHPAWWKWAYTIFGVLEIGISIWLGFILYDKKKNLIPWKIKSEKLIRVVNSGSSTLSYVSVKASPSTAEE